MLKKIKAGLSVVKAGKVVVDPVAWKRGQVGVDAVKAFITAALAALLIFTGQDIVIGESEIDAISAGIVVLVPCLSNLFTIFSTLASTDKKVL